MVARVAFVHTVGFLVDEFRKSMKSDLPGIDCFHVLNESLLQDLLRGGDTAQIYARVVQQIQLAVDAGADLVVMTCSSTSPGIDSARRHIKVPILKIDDPMATAAVGIGSRIGLLCTATSTVEPSSALLRSHALALGREISIQVELNAPAYAALMDGDRAQHDRLMSEAAAKLAGSVDVIVLAQASLAHLQDGLEKTLPCPVLSSPRLLMKELRQRVGQS